MKNYLDKSSVINNGLIIVGIFLLASAVMAAYYIGRLELTNSEPSAAQPSSTPAAAVLPSATEEKVAASPSATPSEESIQTETPGTELTATITQAFSATVEITATPTASPTGMAANPTSNVQPTSTQSPDQAKLITNILPSNGGYYPPKKSFEKSWVIQNTGTTTWTEKYKLVYSGGTQMTNQQSFAIQTPVKPGKTVTVVISLETPKEPGVYEGFWMLQNASGKKFGIGPEADLPLTVKAVVLNISKDTSYDFILEYCEASWKNSEGETISCQSVPRQVDGFVLLDRLPLVENGPSDLPGLWVHPYLKAEGEISGKYPPYLIQAGDHFRAQVGCVAGNNQCNITFKLLYNNGSGSNISLGSWQELYGGGITKINIDLSPLAGENVQFILRTVVSNNKPEDANGIWLIPRITNE